VALACRVEEPSTASIPDFARPYILLTIGSATVAGMVDFKDLLRVMVESNKPCQNIEAQDLVAATCSEPGRSPSLRIVP
jgi:hypothetical protein